MVFALLATIALDRLWLKHAPPRAGMVSGAVDLCRRACCCIPAWRDRTACRFWDSSSSCWAAWRWSQEFASWKRLLIWAGSLAALLYTHYVPGIAAWAGANLLLLRSTRERPSRLLAGNAIVLAAYLPWLMTLASVLAVWRAKPGLLLLTSNSLLESGVKLAYWVFSFFYGEAIPVWMLPVTALLAIPVAWLLWTGSPRRAGPGCCPAAVTALIGFAGVAGWVSYAFGPARLLFLLPLAVLAIAAGAQSSRAREP